MNNPYETCNVCVTRPWCKRYSGEAPLPSGYYEGSECGGYVLLEKALKLSGIPLEYRHANKYHYEFNDDNKLYKGLLTEAFNRPTDLVGKGTNICLFHPNKGTGKSYTACAIANEYIYRTCLKSFDYENPLALYIKFNKWANNNRDRFNDKELTDKALREIESMREVPLLILDDIGSGRLTDYVRDLIYDVIDYRKEEIKSTIYTSNFTEDQLRQPDYLGDMLMSRIMYKSVVISLGGKDRRNA